MALTLDDVAHLTALIEKFKALADTAGGQRKAFAAVDDYLSQSAKVSISSDERRGLRQQAREAAGLEFFPSGDPFATTERSASEPELAQAMIDTEVIAIYW